MAKMSVSMTHFKGTISYTEHVGIINPAAGPGAPQSQGVDTSSVNGTCAVPVQELGVHGDAPTSEWDTPCAAVPFSERKTIEMQQRPRGRDAGQWSVGGPDTMTKPIVTPWMIPEGFLPRKGQTVSGLLSRPFLLIQEAVSFQ